VSMLPLSPWKRRLQGPSSASYSPLRRWLRPRLTAPYPPPTTTPLGLLPWLPTSVLSLLWFRMSDLWSLSS
jgi:hypothetical protein